LEDSELVQAFSWVRVVCVLAENRVLQKAALPTLPNFSVLGPIMCHAPWRAVDRVHVLCLSVTTVPPGRVAQGCNAPYLLAWVRVLTSLNFRCLVVASPS